MPLPDPTGYAPQYLLNDFGGEEGAPPNFAQMVEQLRQQAMMVGQQPIPEYTGGSPKDYLQLLAAQDSQTAASLAGQIGLDLPTIMQEASNAGYYAGGNFDHGVLANAVNNLAGRDSYIGQHIPEVTQAAMLGGGALAGLASAGLYGGAAAGAAPAADGLAPITVNQSLLPGGVGSVFGPEAGAAFAGTAGQAGLAALPAAVATPAAIGSFTGVAPAVAGNALTQGSGTSTVADTVTNTGQVPSPETAGNFFSNPENWLPYVTGGINALLGAHASDKASEAEAAAYQQAIEESKRQYDTTRSDLMPWLTAGQGALTKLQDPNTNFLASPDYAFRRSEGNRDIGNAFAARGMGQSGNALKALNEFNSNLASGEFGNWWNRQAGLAGVGQTTGMQLGTLGANNANNVGNYLAGQGASRASGVLGKYGSLAQGLNQGVGNWLYRRAA